MHSKLIVLVLLTNTLAFAKSEDIDLSNGIALPSNNSAIWENPATLASYSSKSLEGFVQGNPTHWRASFMRPSGGVGFGLGFTDSSAGKSGTAGVGFALGKFDLGVTGSYAFDPSDLSVDLGLRFSPGSLQIAIVLYDLLSFGNQWKLGLGGEISQNLLAEADFRFNHGSDLSHLSSITGVLGASYVQSKKISLRLGFGFLLYPDPQFTLDKPELGLSFHPSDSWVIFGLYQPLVGRIESAKYLAGIKIQ